ncbi:hypothetical protein H4687_000667 [Streptomyces stelliscabiei]|uniref:NAD(P)-binding domain-containing protein n=1 Tax=Streptomyces stelliscabiei TaxID=146820 RepID=A0A8I0NVW2_9ACTN|nr:hypothetical protein [Streptomyces stelliscabiei]
MDRPVDRPVPVACLHSGATSLHGNGCRERATVESARVGRAAVPPSGPRRTRPPSRLRAAAIGRIVRESGLKWTIVRFLMLSHGLRTASLTVRTVGDRGVVRLPRANTAAYYLQHDGVVGHGLELPYGRDHEADLGFPAVRRVGDARRTHRHHTLDTVLAHGLEDGCTRTPPSPAPHTRRCRRGASTPSPGPPITTTRSGSTATEPPPPAPGTGTGPAPPPLGLGLGRRRTGTTSTTRTPTALVALCATAPPAAEAVLALPARAAHLPTTPAGCLFRQIPRRHLFPLLTYL